MGAFTCGYELREVGEELRSVTRSRRARDVCKGTFMTPRELLCTSSTSPLSRASPTALVLPEPVTARTFTPPTCAALPTELSTRLYDHTAEYVALIYVYTALQ